MERDDHEAVSAGSDDLTSDVSLSRRTMVTIAARKVDVFLLYNAQDRSPAYTIGETLRELGVTTWFDIADLAPGMERQKAESDALEGAGAVVVILGPHGWGPSQRSLMERALQIEKRIFPVVYGSAPRDALQQFDGLFERLQRTQLVDGPDDHVALERLASAVRGDVPHVEHRPAPNVERIITTLVNGSDDLRADALESLIASRLAFDHGPLRRRLVEEINVRFSPVGQARDANQIPSIRSWLLSTLAWVCDDDADAGRLLRGHVDRRVEPVPTVRFWTLASLYQTGQADSSLVLEAESDPEPEVSILGQAILAAGDPKRLAQVRAFLGGDGKVLWSALRALRIVPLAPLVPDLCAVLERSGDETVAYDTLYALANPGVVGVAATQLAEAFGLERAVAFLIRAATGSNRRSVRAFARLVSPHGRDPVEAATRANAGGQPPSDTVRSLLRFAFAARSARDEGRLVLAGFTPDTAGSLDDRLGLEVEGVRRIGHTFRISREAVLQWLRTQGHVARCSLRCAPACANPAGHQPRPSLRWLHCWPSSGSSDLLAEYFAARPFGDERVKELRGNAKSSDCDPDRRDADLSCGVE